MPKHFFYHSEIPEEGNETALIFSESHHAVKVLRHKKGDRIGLLDGKAVRSTLDEDNCGLHVVSAVPHDDTFFLVRPQSSAKAMNTKQ